MLSFFLPPSLCDLDVGLEAGSFIEQVAWNRTIQVDSSCHGNSRFPFWRLTVAVSCGPQQHRPTPAQSAAAGGRQLQCDARWRHGAPALAPPPRAQGARQTLPASALRPWPRVSATAHPPRTWGRRPACHPLRGPPSAGRQARRAAGARDERTLFAVACTRLFGQEEAPLGLIPPPLHGPPAGGEPQPLPQDQSVNLLPWQAALLHALHLTRTRCSFCCSKVALRACKPLSG